MKDENLEKAQLAMARRRAAAERLLKPAMQAAAVPQQLPDGNIGYARSRIVMARKR
jgi:hypothetical protein